MPSRLVKQTSGIIALTLGTVVVSASAAEVPVPPVFPALIVTPRSEPQTQLKNNPVEDQALFTPMSDSAAQGMGCLVATTSSLAAAYALGPTELMMLVTGAVIVPSTSSLLFLTLGGILGAGACGVGAALTPSVMWATENAQGISQGITDSIKTSLKPKNGQLISSATDNTTHAASIIRPMNEGEIQGVGCLVGFLGLGAVALATAPTEAVMLAAGGVGLPSNTPLLMMGMLGTLLPAGCTFGTVASLPLVEFYQNFDGSSFGQKLASIIGWGRSPSISIMQQGETEKLNIEYRDSAPKLDVSMQAESNNSNN